MFQVEEVCVHFDELVLKLPDDEFRIKFHPRMTVLSGLGEAERHAMANTIIGALTGGAEQTALRCIDGSGRTIIVLSGDGGPPRARHDDDGSGAAPVGDLMCSPQALRELILVQAEEVDEVARAVQPDEPRELREARISLEEITAQLQKALDEEDRTANLRAQLSEVDEQLEAAEEGLARREYAKVVAQIERVRAEAATHEAGTDGIAEDQQLLARADGVDALMARWTAASERLEEAIRNFGGAELLHSDELSRLAGLPEAPPANLDALVRAVLSAQADHRELDRRLSGITAGKLPTPSEPIIGQLGLLDQSALWGAADRIASAHADIDHLQIALGGLGAEPDGAEIDVIEDMEHAHRALESAQGAAESVRLAGVAGTGFGLSVALAGAVGAPMLIPLGMLIAAAVGVSTLVLPKRRIARAAAAERAALDATGANSYLGFHLRRVEAGLDPDLRGMIARAHGELEVALDSWIEMVGAEVDVEHARAIQAEVLAYHDELKQLGGLTNHIDRLRAELTDRVNPALAATRTALAEACVALRMDPDLDDPSSITAVVNREIERGKVARRQVELERAQTDEQALARELQDKLTEIGIGPGALDVRVSLGTAAVAAAARREEARATARPPAEIAAELDSLQQRAERMRQPEWDTVTADEAEAPDIEELEERRTELQCAIAEARPSVDPARLSDRHDALQRRVATLEAKFSDATATSEPGLVLDIQQHLLSRLGRSAQAGPCGDPVPALLDEVLARVPVDRKWDLLDHLHRLSEGHQIVYLTDDPFVSAWARQQVGGTVSLLEPEPERV
jgi:hypothetical protein